MASLSTFNVSFTYKSLFKETSPVTNKRDPKVVSSDTPKLAFNEASLSTINISLTYKSLFNDTSPLTINLLLKLASPGITTFSLARPNII